MEYNERALNEVPVKEIQVYPHEYEKASNSYLMAVVSIIAGLPLPIINLIAAIGYYLGQRKSTYFVRWHCIQSIIGQALVIPFNSIAFTWTLTIIFNNTYSGNYQSDEVFAENFFYSTSTAYWLYIIFILFLNLIEFIAVIFTASRVRNGHHVRWPLVAGIADSLTSKENRDIYTQKT